MYFTMSSPQFYRRIYFFCVNCEELIIHSIFQTDFQYRKQVIELYTEDGCDRPFFCILETPGAGNVIRIVNTSPVEFPMTAGVVPHSINQEMGSGAVLGGDVVIGGDVGW